MQQTSVSLILVLFQQSLTKDCCPYIHNNMCIFKSNNMTLPDIEPWSPGPLANTLPTRPMNHIINGAKISPNPKQMQQYLYPWFLLFGMGILICSNEPVAYLHRSNTATFDLCFWLEKIITVFDIISHQEYLELIWFWNISFYCILSSCYIVVYFKKKFVKFCSLIVIYSRSTNLHSESRK